MTTKRKTLAEAAVDVLQQSAKEGQEPMHKGPLGAPQPAATVHDLGGATTQNPGGDNVGQRAAAAMSQAKAPKGPVIGNEPRHDGPLGSHQVQNDVKAEVQPTMATPSGKAPTAPGSEEPKPTEGSDSVVDTDKDEKGGKEFHEEMTPEEIAEAAAARREMVLSKIKSFSIEEDFNAIFNGSGLSPEFMTKAKTVFESAVVARAVAVVEEMEKEVLAASEEAVEEIKEEMELQVNAYLDHMVTEWMDTNAVAIESGLRNEINEEFVADLHELFMKHNINIPEEKVDVVESLTDKVTELETKLNEVLNNNVELTKRLNESKKIGLVTSVCEGLTASQTEKIKTLAEGVEFTTESEYRGKLTIIRDQYFPTKTVKVETVTNNSVVLNEGKEPVSTEEVPAEMQHYVAALSLTARK
jgi:hypothetical protein